VCLCVCVCVCVCVFVSVFIYLFVCLFVCVFVCARVLFCLVVRVFVRLSVCVLVCLVRQGGTKYEPRRSHLEIKRCRPRVQGIRLKSRNRGAYRHHITTLHKTSRCLPPRHRGAYRHHIAVVTATNIHHTHVPHIQPFINTRLSPPAKCDTHVHQHLFPNMCLRSPFGIISGKREAIGRTDPSKRNLRRRNLLTSCGMINTFLWILSDVYTANYRTILCKRHCSRTCR